EPDVEVAGLEEAHARRSSPTGAVAKPLGRSRNTRGERYDTFSRGFSASSIDWPSQKQAMITSATHRPAGISAHHAPEEIAVRRKAYSMMLPHVIFVGSP